MGVRLHKLDNLVGRYLDAMVPADAREATGGNIDIIVYLKRHEEDEIFPQDLERRFGITRSTASRVLALMEKKGLIERESVARDARLKRIVMTDKARGLERRLRGNAKKLEQLLHQGLRDDELVVLDHCLEVMRDNLVATGKVGRKEEPRK